jgi:hypothetical protein
MPKASRRREEPNETAARELALFIENDYDLVGAPNSQGKSIEKNLLAKLKKGTFDLGKSEVAWGYLIEAGAKKYAKEFASPGEWSKIFTRPTRELCASYFAISFYEEYKLGNVGEQTPNARIAEIRKAYIRTYSDSGQTKAYVEWVDTRGNEGRTEGDPHNPHMQALLARAKREGVTVKKETW